jgi:hypothetical protein
VEAEIAAIIGFHPQKPRYIIDCFYIIFCLFALRGSKFAISEIGDGIVQ